MLLIVLALAYHAGGYVAGRMSRFDGARQGLGVWLIGLIITILLAIAGAILGSSVNLLAQLNLPTVPLITLVLVLVVTLLAALGGGKAASATTARWTERSADRRSARLVPTPGERCLRAQGRGDW